MNFLQRAAYRFATGGKSFTLGTGFLTGNGDILASANEETWRNTAFSSCLQTLCTSFNEPKLVVKRNDPKQKDPVVITNHPASRLLSKPNPYCTGRYLQTGWMMSRAIDGNGYIRLVFNASKTKVVELYYIPHWALEPVTENGEPGISYYRYSSSALGREPIPANEIIHLRWGCDVQDPRKGWSPVKQLTDELNADTEAALYTYYTLKNPSQGLMVVPGKDVELMPDQIEAIKGEIQKYSSGKKRGGVIALNAEMILSQFGFSPKDVGVSELRRIPEERISAILGVPAIVAGLGAGLSRSTFSNMREAREMFTETTLVPLWADIGDEFTYQLLPWFDGEPVKLSDGSSSVANSETDFICYQTETVRALQEDENERAQRTRNDWMSDGMTHGEYRRAQGRDVDPSRENYYYSQLISLSPDQSKVKAAMDRIRTRTNSNRAELELLNADDTD